MNSTQTYTTQGLPSVDSLEAWRQFMSTVYYRLDIVAKNKERIRGELREAQFQSIGVSSFKADAQRVVRYKEAAQIDGSENFVFLFPTHEPMQFEQLGKTGVVEPGDVVILNSGEGYTVTVPDESENITLKIPCDVLRARLPRMDGRCALSGVANAALAPVVSRLGEQLLQLQASADSLRLQDAVLDLTCLMLDLDNGSSNLELTRQPLAEVMFERLSAYLDRHLRDPDLTPERVAQAHRISVRYLHKVFQIKGASFGRALMETRLVEARRLLRRGDERIHIGQVAFACGFSNQAHFSARYRARFGMAPRETERASC